MRVTKNGLAFDSPSEAAAFGRVAKTELYAAGWKWTGRVWRLVERRRPGKLLIVELPNWAEAYDHEMQMQGRLPAEGAQEPKEGGAA